MEMHLGTRWNVARWSGLCTVASVLLVGCIPQQHRLADQARVLRWEQDSTTLVSRIVLGSSELGLLKNGLEQLDSTVVALSKERDSIVIVVQDQSRRADTLAGLVQRESVLRDLLRMDLAAAQQAEQLHQKRADSLKIEVQFLTEKLNARPMRPVPPRSAVPTNRGQAAAPRPKESVRPPQ
jgi:hypothetical protein